MGSPLCTPALSLAHIGGWRGVGDIVTTLALLITMHQPSVCVLLFCWLGLIKCKLLAEHQEPRFEDLASQFVGMIVTRGIYGDLLRTLRNTWLPPVWHILGDRCLQMFTII